MLKYLYPHALYTSSVKINLFPKLKRLFTLLLVMKKKIPLFLSLNKLGLSLTVSLLLCKTNVQTLNTNSRGMFRTMLNIYYEEF